MKHPTLFGVRMSKHPDLPHYKAVTGSGTPFQVTAYLYCNDQRWQSRIAVNGKNVYFSPRSYKTLATASDRLADACGWLDRSAEAMVDGKGTAPPWD